MTGSYPRERRRFPFDLPGRQTADVRLPLVLSLPCYFCALALYGVRRHGHHGSEAARLRRRRNPPICNAERPSVFCLPPGMPAALICADAGAYRPEATSVCGRALLVVNAADGEVPLSECQLLTDCVMTWLRIRLRQSKISGFRTRRTRHRRHRRRRRALRVVFQQASTCRDFYLPLAAAISANDRRG